MYRSDESPGYSFGGRDDRVGPVTCEVCGCRLQPTGTEGTWVHFGALGGRDAMGCRVACVDLAHDGSGRAAQVSVAI
jgi:hypothetical protein